LRRRAGAAGCAPQQADRRRRDRPFLGRAADDTTTGLVTFGTPPALSVEVTADLEFDVPVRFDTDHMAVTIETYRLHAWQQIPIVELRT
jgi:uncharacterized protein (TIGR02217 family)